jgi:hypothetical protein
MINRRENIRALRLVLMIFLFRPLGRLLHCPCLQPPGVNCALRQLGANQMAGIPLICAFVRYCAGNECKCTCTFHHAPRGVLNSSTPAGLGNLRAGPQHM